NPPQGDTDAHRSPNLSSVRYGPSVECSKGAGTPAAANPRGCHSYGSRAQPDAGGETARVTGDSGVSKFCRTDSFVGSPSHCHRRTQRHWEDEHPTQVL